MSGRSGLDKVIETPERVVPRVLIKRSLRSVPMALLSPLARQLGLDNCTRRGMTTDMIRKCLFREAINNAEIGRRLHSLIGYHMGYHRRKTMSRYILVYPPGFPFSNAEEFADYAAGRGLSNLLHTYRRPNVRIRRAQILHIFPDEVNNAVLIHGVVISGIAKLRDVTNRRVEIPRTRSFSVIMDLDRSIIMVQRARNRKEAKVLASQVMSDIGLDNVSRIDYPVVDVAQASSELYEWADAVGHVVIEPQSSIRGKESFSSRKRQGRYLDLRADEEARVRMTEALEEGRIRKMKIELRIHNPQTVLEQHYRGVRIETDFTTPKVTIYGFIDENSLKKNVLNQVLEVLTGGTLEYEQRRRDLLSYLEDSGRER